MKLNNYLFSLLVLFCIGAAHGVTFRCEDVEVQERYRYPDMGGGSTGDTFHRVYIKFEYTEGNAANTIELKLIRRKPIMNQVIKFADSDLQINVENGIIMNMQNIDADSLSDSIAMKNQGNNTWKVRMRVIFSQARFGLKATYYGDYEGAMTCQKDEEKKG